MWPIGSEVPPNCSVWLIELHSKIPLASGAPISGRNLSFSASIISCHECNVILCAYPTLHRGLLQMHIQCCNPLLNYHLLHHLFQRLFDGVSCAIILNMLLCFELIHLIIFNIMHYQSFFAIYSRVLTIDHLFLFTKLVNTSETRIHWGGSKNPESSVSDMIQRDSYLILWIRLYPYRVRRIPTIPCTDMAESHTIGFAWPKSANLSYKNWISLILSHLFLFVK